jgi:hypothetical protein
LIRWSERKRPHRLEERRTGSEQVLREVDVPDHSDIVEVGAADLFLRDDDELLLLAIAVDEVLERIFESLDEEPELRPCGVPPPFEVLHRVDDGVRFEEDIAERETARTGLSDMIDARGALRAHAS